MGFFWGGGAGVIFDSFDFWFVSPAVYLEKVPLKTLGTLKEQNLRKPNLLKKF